jgi:hypothetical protein
MLAFHRHCRRHLIEPAGVQHKQHTLALTQQALQQHVDVRVVEAAARVVLVVESHVGAIHDHIKWLAIVHPPLELQQHGTNHTARDRHGRRRRTGNVCTCHHYQRTTSRSRARCGESATRASVCARSLSSSVGESSSDLTRVPVSAHHPLMARTTDMKATADIMATQAVVL